MALASWCARPDFTVRVRGARESILTRRKCVYGLSSPRTRPPISRSAYDFLNAKEEGSESDGESTSVRPNSCND